MTDQPPITWPEASSTISQWLYHIKKGGPDVYDMSRPEYAKAVKRMEDVAKLLQLTVEHKAKRSGGAS